LDAGKITGSATPINYNVYEDSLLNMTCDNGGYKRSPVRDFTILTTNKLVSKCSFGYDTVFILTRKQ